MTDDQMIDWYAAQEDSLKPSQVEGWRRLIALARKGAAVQKMLEPQKSVFFNESVLGKDETRILYENLSRLYLEQTP